MKSVITCDLEGLIETINPDGEKLFGYTKKELVGKKRVSIFSSGEVVIQNVGLWLSSALKNGEHNTKTYFIRKDGTKWNAAIKITPTYKNGKNNPPTGYCGITIPINEEVKVPIKFSTIFIKWAFAITRGGFTSASLFPIFAIAAFFAGSGDGLFSVLSLVLCAAGIVFLHVSSNLFNDYYDVKDGTDGANTEYFNAGLNSTVLEGAQLSGGSRSIELGLITLDGTLSLARKMLVAAVILTAGLLYNSYLVTGEISNAQNAFQNSPDVASGHFGHCIRSTQRPLSCGRRHERLDRLPGQNATGHHSEYRQVGQERSQLQQRPHRRGLLRSQPGCHFLRPVRLHHRMLPKRQLLRGPPRDRIPSD